MTEYDVQPDEPGPLPEMPGVPPVQAPAVRAPNMLWPAALAIAGVLLIATMAIMEESQLDGKPWRYAIISRSGEPPWDGTIPIHVRKVPAENFPPSPLAEALQDTPGGSDVTGILKSSLREAVVAIDLPEDGWKTILGHGRPPVPGQHEVLAGKLCRLEQFTMDGQRFTVVGRLKSSVAGLSFAYLVPYGPSVAPLFTEDAGATSGWLDPDGLKRPAATEQELNKLQGEQQVVAPLIPNTPLVAWGGFLGILLVVIGGATLQVRLLQQFNRRIPLFCDFIDTIDRFPRLFVAVHLLCYGALLGASLLAFFSPVTNLQVLTYVTEVFTSGGLEKLGAAYMSGNVMGAAWQTFLNNFIVQTVGTAVLPSLLIPFWGLLKTMLNLAVAGFALAPIWAGLLARFTYHSVTLSLEVEAYVLAVFAICLYPVYIYRAFTSEEPGRGFGRAFTMLGWGTVLSGVLLFISAFYEAVTLIILG